MQAHTRVDQSFAKRKPQARCKVVAMQQQRFKGITRAGIVELGVENRLDRELSRCVMMHVSSTKAVRMAHDRNTSFTLDVSDHLVRATRNHEVDVAVLL